MLWGCSFGGDFPEVAVFLQAELIVGDQSGAIHIWDLKTDHNEQLIPEPEVSVNSVHIDPDASYMAAVNSSVSSDGLGRGLGCTGGLLHAGRAPRSHIPWSFPALWWGAGSPGCFGVGATSPAINPPLPAGKLLRVEPDGRHRGGGDPADPQDQDPGAQPLRPAVQVQPRLHVSPAGPDGSSRAPGSGLRAAGPREEWGGGGGPGVPGVSPWSRSVLWVPSQALGSTC